MADIQGTEFITPMQPWKLTGFSTETVTDRRNLRHRESEGAILFRNVFQSAVNEVKSTQLDVENKQYLLATGQLEDAHSLPIAESKAAISLDLLISLRNKAIEGYNELLKLNI